MRKILILVLLTFFFLPSLIYAGDDLRAVTPSSVTGRVLPLPLKQGQRRIKLEWGEPDDTTGFSQYCIYYREVDAAPSTAPTDCEDPPDSCAPPPPCDECWAYQPCYTYGSGTVYVTSTSSESITITDLDYDNWYVFQIVFDTTGTCSACTDANTGDGNDMSDPSPLESYGVYIPKSALKWEEYTE